MSKDKVYRLLEPFVEEVYINTLNEDGCKVALSYLDTGGSPGVAVATGWYESEDVTLEKVAEELDVSRRSVYNARKKLDLEIRERTV